MAYPIFHHTRIYTLNTTAVPGFERISFCIEDWQLSDNVTDQDPGTRIYYSIFSMAFQFLIPFVLISAIYFCIYVYLNKHRYVHSYIFLWRHVEEAYFQEGILPGLAGYPSMHTDSVV